MQPDSLLDISFLDYTYWLRLLTWGNTELLAFQSLSLLRTCNCWSPESSNISHNHVPMVTSHQANVLMRCLVLFWSFLIEHLLRQPPSKTKQLQCVGVAHSHPPDARHHDNVFQKAHSHSSVAVSFTCLCGTNTKEVSLSAVTGFSTECTWNTKGLIKAHHVETPVGTNERLLDKHEMQMNFIEDEIIINALSHPYPFSQIHTHRHTLAITFPMISFSASGVFKSV